MILAASASTISAPTHQYFSNDWTDSVTLTVEVWRVNRLDQTERWLLGVLRTRDRDISEAFVDVHYAGLFRWFNWLCNDCERAADLTQETFLAFWDSLDRGDAGTPARVWLLSVGRNVWRNSCRRRSREIRLMASETSEILADQRDDASDPVADASRSESVVEIQRAVAALPPEFREAVTLRYWRDLSYAEIAQILGITPELARWRVFHGRQLLRDRLVQLAPEGGKHDSQ